MGTSNSFGGSSGDKPLIPSWIDDAGGRPAPAPPKPELPVPVPTPVPGQPPPVVPMPAVPLPFPIPAVPQLLASPHRFTAPRTNFTRFAASGGSDRKSLGRALAGYVRGAKGGSATAARGMGSSRRAGGSLAGFLSSAQANGVQEALRSLNLEALAGQPVEDIFLGLVDYICPDGGSIDDAIARDAFVETIADLSEAGITDMDSLTAGQIQTVLELYATHAIEARICNDIGAKLIQMPNDPTAALRVQEQLNDFIRRGVSDGITRLGTAPQGLTAEQTGRFMTEVYEAAFDALQTLGDAEG